MILCKNIRHHRIALFSALIFSIIYFNVLGQSISVKQIKVNDFDETSFAPYVYEGWLYFSSNKKRNTLSTTVLTEDGSHFFDLYKTKLGKGNKVKSKVIPLSDSLNRIFNETSMCIYNDEVYFSTNSFNKKNKKKVGNFNIYIAKKQGDKIVNIKPFEFNDTRFNVAHPTISEDGKLLVFSSDNMAGEGWSDLYFCKKEKNNWSAPQNLGININTEAMETFPRLIGNKLYFSSDRKGGKGGLDIYCSKLESGKWSAPKLLPEPINSKNDDFGYTLNADMKSGFFTSNRKKKKDEIYYFEYDMPITEDFYQQELYFCYTFEELEMKETDSLKFSWDIGDGKIIEKAVVDYCYEDTGVYEVSMNIIDKYTGTIFEKVSSYNIEINAHNKPVIDFSDIKPGVVNVFLEDKWTTTDCSSFYWIVDGDYIFEKNFKYQFYSKSEINVKLVVWDDKDNVIGVERVIYK